MENDGKVYTQLPGDITEIEVDGKEYHNVPAHVTILWQLVKLLVLGGAVVLQVWGLITLGIYVDFAWMLLGFVLMLVGTVLTAIDDGIKGK